MNNDWNIDQIGIIDRSQKHQSSDDIFNFLVTFTLTDTKTAVIDKLETILRQAPLMIYFTLP